MLLLNMDAARKEPEGTLSMELLSAARRVWEAEHEIGTVVQSVWIRDAHVVVTIRQSLPKAIEQRLTKIESRLLEEAETASN